ncbi:hypothetical protein Misp04_25250 [Micromonospora sp. NBRC 101691]|nr:hypothetical protein Misp04_25250 [Micromonospora sp. NBRC 101691]
MPALQDAGLDQHLDRLADGDAGGVVVLGELLGGGQLVAGLEDPGVDLGDFLAVLRSARVRVKAGEGAASPARS